MTRVLLVDDHPVVREGLATILGSDPGLDVVAGVASAEEALRMMPRLKPQVVVTDVQLPGIDGVALCEKLREKYSKVRVVVLTRFPNESIMLRAFTAGAKGFMVKECDPDLLRQGVKVVIGQGIFVDPNVTSKLIALATKGRRAKGPHGLTMQQMRVLELLPKGLSNREIGSELGLSEETVKTHLRLAMQKLNVTDRTEAAVLAQREGLA